MGQHHNGQDDNDSLRKTQADSLPLWCTANRYSAPDPFEPTERRTCQFLDLDATRRQMHAQPTSDISSILAGGKVAWAGFNHTNDFVRSGVPDARKQNTQCFL